MKPIKILKMPWIYYRWFIRKNQYEQVIIHLSIKNQSIGLGILIKYKKNKWNIEWKNSCLSGHKN